MVLYSSQKRIMHRSLTKVLSFFYNLSRRIANCTRQIGYVLYVLKERERTRQRKLVGMVQSRQARPDTKIQTICTHLSELAVEKGPHARLPTIRELCDLFATSRVTLDEALYTLEQQNVIYRKQGSGIFVSPKIYRKSICILLESAWLSSTGASPFWGMLWGLLAQEARRRARVKNEYHIFNMVVNAVEQDTALPEDVVLMIEAGRIHAVLAIGLNEEVGNWLKQQQVPCITFGVYSKHMVLLDEQTLVELAVQNLAEQGCRKIALWAISGDQRVTEGTTHRVHNPYFPTVLAKHGLPFRPGLMRDYLSPPLSTTPVPYQEQGYLLAMDVFGDPDTTKPDGIFITNDMMTDGVLAAFRVLGIRPGEDAKIATHGNVGSMMSFNHIPGLTVVEFDPQEIVLAMFEMLDAVLADQTADEIQVHIKPNFRRPA